MATAEQVLAIAKAELGVTEYPPNSNKVKYWDAFEPHWNGEPWCDRFVSWCGWMAGAADLVGVFDYCPYHVNWFKNTGRWLDREEKPQPGDIVFFANRGTACHVGIVETRNGTSSVTTIEGNTSSTDNANGGRVERRVRNYGAVGSSWYIMGFGRPGYDVPGQKARDRRLQLWAPSLTNINQQFWPRAIEPGKKIALRSVACDEWISDPGSSQTQVAAETWEGTEGNRDPRAPQVLILEPADALGGLYIHPEVAPMLSLDAAGAVAKDGTPVQWYPHNGTKAQVWHFVKVNDAYMLINAATLKALDVPNGGWK